MELKRIDPWSCAKMLAVMYLAVGLVGIAFAACFAVGTSGGFTIVSNSNPGGFHPANQGPGMGGFVAALFLYPLMGAVTGLVTAVVYNVVAGFVGGIRIELKDE